MMDALTAPIAPPPATPHAATHAATPRQDRAASGFSQLLQQARQPADNDGSDGSAARDAADAARPRHPARPARPGQGEGRVEPRTPAAPRQAGSAAPDAPEAASQEDVEAQAPAAVDPVAAPPADALASQQARSTAAPPRLATGHGGELAIDGAAGTSTAALATGGAHAAHAGRMHAAGAEGPSPAHADRLAHLNQATDTADAMDRGKAALARLADPTGDAGPPSRASGDASGTAGAQPTGHDTGAMPALPPTGMAPTSTSGTAGGTPAAAESPTRSLAPEVGSPGFAPALGSQVSLLIRDGLHEARLQLNPAEMGPVVVQITIDGQAARVDFHADHAATRQALESSLPALAGALHESGLTLAGGGVFQGQPGPRDGARDGPPAAAAARNGDRGTAADEPATGAAPATAPPRARRGLVDLLA